MGHLLGTKSSLVPLIDRLNLYPIGLVDNHRLRQILALLFEEREAFVASRFPLHEATLAELADLTGVPVGELKDILNRMADKGLVMDLPYAGTTYYLLVPGLIGFMEFSFMRRRADLPQDLPLPELARLMNDYLRERGAMGQGAEFFGSATQLTRALAYPEHIPVSSRIAAFEDARRIIEDADYCAVTLCYWGATRLPRVYAIDSSSTDTTARPIPSGLFGGVRQARKGRTRQRGSFPPSYGGKLGLVNRRAHDEEHERLHE
jgi:hypothetical protein